MQPATASGFWRRCDVPGHDAARLHRAASGWRLTGTAIFHEAGQLACLHYSVHLDASWATLSANVSGYVGNDDIEHEVSRTTRGWTHNGHLVEGLDDLMDIDFGFTPATNLPQIRRMALGIGQAAEIEVAWLDSNSKSLSRLLQRYERRTTDTYWYESPSASYSAMLQLSDDGFVNDYPTLWRQDQNPGTLGPSEFNANQQAHTAPIRSLAKNDRVLTPRRKLWR